MKTIPHPDPLRRSRTPILFPLLWLCAGIALGFALRSFFQEEAPPAPSPAPPRQDHATLQNKPSVTGKETPASAPAFPPLERLRQLTEIRGRVDFVEAAQLIRQLEASECKRALALIRRINGEEKRALLDVLAGHWAKLNPYAAFDAAETEARDNDWRNRLGFAAGAALATTDPNSALERIKAIRHKGRRQKAEEWILPELVKSQPRLVIDFLKASPLEANHSHVYFSIAQNFARSSPQEAITWAKSLQHREGVGIVRAAWLGWAETDPIAAAAAIQSGSEKVDDNVYQMIGNAWSRKDPFAALAWAESLTNKADRAHTLRAMELDFEKYGAEGARQFIASLTDEEQRMSFANRLAENIARQDVSAAIALAESLPAENLRFNALTPAIDQWAASDPAAAARYIAALPESKQTAELMRRSMQKWAELDPDAAFAYISQLPSGENRDRAVLAAIRQTRDENPQRALEWFEKVQDQETRGSLAKDLAASVVKNDPTKALALMEEVPMDRRPDAYKDLIRGWAFDQPHPAGEWINSLPAGAGRDAAVKAYVSVIDGMDPALATKWAQSIVDPFERIGASIESFTRWKKKDEAAARAWLETAPATDREFYDRILNDPKYANGFD